MNHRLWLLISAALLALFPLAAAVHAQEKGTLVLAPFREAGVPKAEVKSQSDKPQTFPIEKSQKPVRVELPPGRYAIQFESAILTPIRDVVIDAGKETKVDLAAVLGKVRLTPMEQDKFSWLEVLDADGKRVQALYPNEQSPFYGLAPGRYQIKFDRTYLSPVPVEVKAGQETEVKLADVLGKVRLTPMEQDKFSWLEVLDADGKRVQALYPNEQSPFYGLAPGRYQIKFDRTYLSPVPVEVKAGQETEVKLADVLGKVRLTPMDKDKFSWLEVLDADGKRVQAIYPNEQSPFYGLAPGRYQVRFEKRYLTPVPFTVEAGKERLLDLQKELGRLEFDLIGGAQPDQFELLDADRGTGVASVGDSQGAYYGLAPGRYRLRFRGRDLPEVKVVVAAGRRTLVVPGKTEAVPEGLIQTPLLPVRAKAGDTTVELSWDQPAGLEVAGYRVYRQGVERPIQGQKLTPKPQFQDIGLINGRPYTYIIRAVLADGTEWRDYQTASATPKEGEGDKK